MTRKMIRNAIPDLDYEELEQAVGEDYEALLLARFTEAHQGCIAAQARNDQDAMELDLAEMFEVVYSYIRRQGFRFQHIQGIATRKRATHGHYQDGWVRDESGEVGLPQGHQERGQHGVLRLDNEVPRPEDTAARPVPDLQGEVLG